MPVTKTIKPLTLSQYRAIVAGIPTYCPNAVFILAGQTFTAVQAVAFVQTVLASVSAVATAKTAWTDAKAAEEQLFLHDGLTMKLMRENIASMFVNSTTTLAAFEIAPKKVRQPLSNEARAAATAKLRATRLARGTTSKKQKVLADTHDPETSGSSWVALRAVA